MLSGKVQISSNAYSFNILEKDIYTNPELAIIRELSCNALDSHFLAEASKSFEIGFEDDDVFFVKDYGTGLDEESVVNTFAGVFASTKRGDSEQTGCFGLGSKTPFAYCKNDIKWYVESNFDGKKYTFEMYKDKGINSYKEISIEDTKEENGVKIYFKLRHYNDRNIFEKNIKDYFSENPQIMNVKFVGIKDVSLEEIEKRRKAYLGKNLIADPFLPEYNISFKIRMNDVCYDCSDNLINGDFDVYAFKKLILSLGCNVCILDAPNKSLPYGASRESIQFDDETNKKVKEMFRNFYNEKVEELKAELLDDINNSKDIKELLETENKVFHFEDITRESFQSELSSKFNSIEKGNIIAISCLSPKGKSATVSYFNNNNRLSNLRQMQKTSFTILKNAEGKLSKISPKLEELNMLGKPSTFSSTAALLKNDLIVLKNDDTSALDSFNFKTIDAESYFAKEKKERTKAKTFYVVPLRSIDRSRISYLEKKEMMEDFINEYSNKNTFYITKDSKESASKLFKDFTSFDGKALAKKIEVVKYLLELANINFDQINIVITSISVANSLEKNSYKKFETFLSKVLTNKTIFNKFNEKYKKCFTAKVIRDNETEYQNNCFITCSKIQRIEKMLFDEANDCGVSLLNYFYKGGYVKGSSPVSNILKGDEEVEDNRKDERVYEYIVENLSSFNSEYEKYYSELNNEIKKSLMNNREPFKADEIASINNSILENFYSKNFAYKYIRYANNSEILEEDKLKIRQDFIDSFEKVYYNYNK